MRVNRFFHLISIILLTLPTVVFGASGDQIANVKNNSRLSDQELFQKAQKAVTPQERDNYISELVVRIDGPVEKKLDQKKRVESAKASRAGVNRAAEEMLRQRARQEEIRKEEELCWGLKSIEIQEQEARVKFYTALNNVPKEAFWSPVYPKALRGKFLDKKRTFKQKGMYDFFDHVRNREGKFSLVPLNEQPLGKSITDNFDDYLTNGTLVMDKDNKHGELRFALRLSGLTDLDLFKIPASSYHSVTMVHFPVPLDEGRQNGRLSVVKIPSLDMLLCELTWIVEYPLELKNSLDLEGSLKLEGSLESKDSLWDKVGVPTSLVKSSSPELDLSEPVKPLNSWSYPRK
ncbi:MAG: hypothetical protein NTZ68_02805 [Candidatus Dependentiae bacterium]|nr:hypothetical protein [Candidatus Dependentiae bacterium]